MSEPQPVLTDVPYIADTREQYFREAGYETPEQLLDVEAEDLVTEVYAIGPTAAKRILEGVRELFDEDEPELSDVEFQTARDLHEGTTQASDAEVAEAVPEPDVTAEQFERRLVTRERGEELWYRNPETGSLIIPYDAPGFEAWCEEHDRDPEDFRS